MKNPPIHPISREQQLVMQNDILMRQLQQQGALRASASKLALGEIMDGISFTLLAAESLDPETKAVSIKDLANLKKLLEKVLVGDWTSPVSRIAIPR